MSSCREAWLHGKEEEGPSLGPSGIQGTGEEEESAKETE